MSCGFTLDDGTNVLLPLACQMTISGKVTHSFAYEIRGPGDVDHPLVNPKWKIPVTEEEKKKDTNKDGHIKVTSDFSQKTECIPCGLVDWSKMGTSSWSDVDGRTLNDLWKQYEADVKKGIPKTVNKEIIISTSYTYAIPVTECDGCTINNMNTLNAANHGDTQDLLATVGGYVRHKSHLYILANEATHQRARWIAALTWMAGGITMPGYSPSGGHLEGNQQ